MGGGCFKDKSRDDGTHRIAPYVDQGTGSTKPSYGEESGRSTPPKSSSSPELKAHIAPVIKAAGQSKYSDAKLDEMLETLSCGIPSEVSGELMAWWADASVKARGGLLELLKRVISRSLDDKVAAAEKSLTRRGHDVAEADFGRLADFCKEDLRVESQSKGILAATMALSAGAAVSDNPEAHVVPAFERIILLFRHAFLAHIGSSAVNLHKWHEFAGETGLPPLDENLGVLSSSSKAVMISLLLIPEGAPPSSVIMKRDSTLSYVEKQLPEKHACVLSPYFESATGTKVIQGKRVEGGEGHGPRKEFFFTSSSNSLKVMFEFHRGTGDHWFNGYADDLNEERRSCCRSFGKLLVLAMANRCKISFTLPALFFKLLLYRKYETSMGDLQGFDNALLASCRKCLKMGSAQFKSLKEVEGHPASMTQEEYVVEQVRTLLRPQGMLAIQDGFWSLATEKMLCGMTPNDLRTIICPIEKNHSADVNIRQTFKVVMEEELEENKVFVDALWKVVDGLSKAEKRLFLVFVTGVEMPPEPGTEQLIIDTPFSAFSKDEHIEMLSKLPQAHTCTNTLELPNYHDALVESGTLGDNPEKIPAKTLATQLQRVLGEKLRLAINESKGYELDAIEPASQATATGNGTSVSNGFNPPPFNPAPFNPAPFNPASSGFRPTAQDAQTSGLRPQQELSPFRPPQEPTFRKDLPPVESKESTSIETSPLFRPSQEVALGSGLKSSQEATSNGFYFRSHQELPPLRQEANGFSKRISPERTSPTDVRDLTDVTDLTDELMRVSPTEELLRKSPVDLVTKDLADSPVESVASVSPVGEPSTSLLLDEGNRALRELSTPSPQHKSAPQHQSAPRPQQKEQGPAQGHGSIDDFLQECDDLIASYQEEFDGVDEQTASGRSASGRIVPTPLLT